MSDAIEADVFIQNPERVHQLILQDLLGEREDLIRSVADSIKVVSQIPTGEHCTICDFFDKGNQYSTGKFFATANCYAN